MAQDSNSVRRSVVLLEEIRSEVRKVAEGHGVLVRGQEDIRVAMEHLGARVEQLEHAVIDGFKSVQASTHSLTVRFDTHERTHMA